jgi:hypothetical protein
VVFTVGSGGGSVTGGTQVADAAGEAVVGSWTLGNSVGSNTLIVSAGAATPVTFSATATAGAAATITKTSGDGQSANVGTEVPISPQVTIRDANGNPVPGVFVEFAVGSGGGTVIGGTQSANSAGVATVGGWRLGPTAGSNTLTATVFNLSPVTFIATAQ